MTPTQEQVLMTAFFDELGNIEMEKEANIGANLLRSAKQTAIPLIKGVSKKGAKGREFTGRGLKDFGKFYGGKALLGAARNPIKTTLGVGAGLGAGYAITR